MVASFERCENELLVKLNPVELRFEARHIITDRLDLV